MCIFQKVESISFTHFLNKDSLSTYWGHNTSFPLLTSHLSSVCFQQTVSSVKHHSRPWRCKGDRAKFIEFTLLERNCSARWKWKSTGERVSNNRPLLWSQTWNPVRTLSLARYAISLNLFLSCGNNRASVIVRNKDQGRCSVNGYSYNSTGRHCTVSWEYGRGIASRLRRRKCYLVHPGKYAWADS